MNNTENRTSCHVQAPQRNASTCEIYNVSQVPECEAANVEQLTDTCRFHIRYLIYSTSATASSYFKKLHMLFLLSSSL